MMAWASKYLVQAFICIADYDTGVKMHLCSVEYKAQPPKPEAEPPQEETTEETLTDLDPLEIIDDM